MEPRGTSQEIVKTMALGSHRTSFGFMQLLQIAVSMNGDGRFRQSRWLEIIQ